MMCTINVTAGRLHFRGIDLLLEFTERCGSRAESEPKRMKRRSGAKNDVMRGTNAGLLLWALKVSSMLSDLLPACFKEQTVMCTLGSSIKPNVHNICSCYGNTK